MAEKVDAFPLPTTQASEYWDQYNDGSIWRLDEADWKARYQTIESARSGARYYGQARKMKVKVQSNKDDLFVQFIKQRIFQGNPEGQGLGVIEGGNGGNKRRRRDQAEVTHSEEEPEPTG